MRPRTTLLLALLTLLLVSGQAFGQSRLTFGFKAGMSLSELDIDSSLVDLGSRSKLTGGGFVVIDLPGSLDLQVEALYVSKGAKQSLMAVDEMGAELGEFTQHYVVEYLEVPVLVRLGLGGGPLHLLAGPALGYKMSSKLTASNVPGVGEIHEDWEGITDTDLGLVVGAGTSFGRIIVDARYTLGLTNINDTAGGWDTKNKALSVMAGITF